MAKTTPTKNRTPRKRTSTTEQAGTRQAQDTVNQLFVAHQVHTLANMLFHKMALAGQESWSAGAAGQQPQQHPATSFGFGATPWNAGPWQTAAGAQHGVSQPLLYWYP